MSIKLWLALGVQVLQHVFVVIKAVLEAAQIFRQMFELVFQWKDILVLCFNFLSLENFRTNLNTSRPNLTLSLMVDHLVWATPGKLP